MGRGRGVASDWDAPAPHIVNETKQSIITVMRALGRPTTPEELRIVWGKRLPLAVFDYHLSTLVQAGVAEFATDGPVLRFRLIGGPACRSHTPTGSGAASARGEEAHQAVAAWQGII